MREPLSQPCANADQNSCLPRKVLSHRCATRTSVPNLKPRETKPQTIHHWITSGLWMTLQSISHHSSFWMFQFTFPLSAKYIWLEQVEKRILVLQSWGRLQKALLFLRTDEGKDLGEKCEVFWPCLVCKARHEGKLQQLDMLSIPLLKDLHTARAQCSSLSTL